MRNILLLSVVLVLSGCAGDIQDAGYTQAIYDLTGRDFRASWAAHGQTWDDFVNDMWDLYRR